jgi:hypothetical protein
MSSPGHRGNILGQGFREIGVGGARTANGMVKLTQAFGDPTGDVQGGPTGLEPEFQEQQPADPPAEVPAPEPAPEPAPLPEFPIAAPNRPATPAPTPAKPTATPMRLATSTVHMTRRGVRARLTCSKGGRCTGTTTIRTRVRGRTITARATYAIPAGQTRWVEFRLSARDRTLVRTAKRFTTKLTMTGKHNGRAYSLTRTVTLRVA